MRKGINSIVSAQSRESTLLNQSGHASWPFRVHPMTLRLLLTAGPTREPIDGVRYLSNRSSGKMGLAVASEAALRGWPTTLLLSSSIDAPLKPGLTCKRFTTTADLQSLLEEEAPACDVLIMAAAVSDFIPRCDGNQHKLDRSSGPITLTMDPAPDLIAQVARDARIEQTMIGFALEPGVDLHAAATAKLKRKQLHAIVANPLETMDAETITAVLIHADEGTDAAPPNLTKHDFAPWLLDRVEQLHERRLGTLSSAPPCPPT